VLCAEGHASKITLIRIQLEPLAPEMAALGLAEVRFKGGLWTRKKLSLPKSPAASPVTAAYPSSSTAEPPAVTVEEPTSVAPTRGPAQAVAPSIQTPTSNQIVEKPFIICLIDGSSLCFPPELVSESRSGGLAWASRLERLLRGVEHVNGSQAIITVTFFCDINELKSSLLYGWDISPVLLDGFMEGFAEHASTFSIRNVRTSETAQILQGELSTGCNCLDR